MKPKKYITQLTAKDMQEIAAATNLEPGWLVTIDKTEDKIKIGIDYTQFALAMQAIFGLTPSN